VDKKDFFQHLKNPPKKVLKDLVSTNSSDSFPTNFTTTESLASKAQSESSRDSENSNFANFDQFDENEANQSSQQVIDSPPKKETPAGLIHHQPLSVSLPPEETTSSKGTIMPATASGGSSVLRSMDRDSTESTQALVKLPSPKKYLQSVRKKDFDIDLPTSKSQSVESSKFPVDFSVTNESPASPLRSCSSDANSRLSSSSAELDLVPEPPPRGAGSILINPPPLPPKKQSIRGGARPPPRPPHTDGHFQYDFPQREASSPSPTRILRDKNKSPPRDVKDHQFDDNFSPPPQMPARSDFMATTTTTSAFEDSFSTMIPSTTSLPSTPFTSSITGSVMDSKKTKLPLDITLSQLTSSWTNLDELASSLGMTVQQLTSLTLTQLTQCLASLSTKETVIDDVEETVNPSMTTKEQPVVPSQPVLSSLSSLTSKSLETTSPSSTSFTSSEVLKSNYESEPKQDPTYDKYAVFRELLEMEQIERKEETNVEEIAEVEEASNENEQVDEEKIQPEMRTSEITSDSLTSLTVKLSSRNENLLKEEPTKLNETMINSLASLTEQKEMLENEDKNIEKENEVITDADMTSDSSTVQQTEIDAEDDTEKTQTIMEEKVDNSEKGSDANGTLSDKVGSDILNEETNGSVAERSSTEVKSSTSTSSDRYAALREIIGEPEPSPIKKDDEEMMSSARTSPVIQSQQPKSLAEIELLNLFSDNLPPPSSPNISAKKDSVDLKAVAMDIFEEIKMLNTDMHRAKDIKPTPPLTSGFEDMFCPFSETTRSEKDDGKEDGNWAKFDTGIFGSSDKSLCEGQRSIGGTSPWSPDGKDFHKEVPFKGSSGYRHSGDSDNEWKDEEESEESNGRGRGESRFWSGSRHPRFDAPGFEDRSFYEESGEKRDRSFRERMGRKSRGAPWTKSSGSHRPRDPSPWHEESQWDDEGPRRYPHRKVQPYKDDEDQYEAHWKCRPKPPPQRCNWSHDSYYDDERKRKLMLWNEEDRFGSQESMGYDEEDRWSRRRYERRRWEEDSRFWSRRGPPDADYPMREAYYYYRESRERPHDYPSWDEEYASERPGDDSPRYNPAGRKRHWPKRPNSANDGRNSDMLYLDSRKFGGASRSECSDNDSDPYLRPSQRSRSRESYWGSDQEYDSWVERPYWSEGPDSKSETMHRKRIARHKTRQTQKTQSPFEDDFAQSVEQAEPPSAGPGVGEPLAPMDARVRLEMTEQKREPPPPVSPSSGVRGSSKDPPRRDMSVRPTEYGKRSSYFEDDLTPTASASSDASDRPRLSSDFKATPEELPCDTSKDPQQPVDGFVSEDSGRDSFFNGDLRFDDDAFVFKSELDDNVPDHRATTLPLKNSRQGKYGPGNNNNNNKAARGDQYIRKSESVNIFARESDPFDGDDFFN